VQELRNDGKGRHTTTRRELIILPNGGLMIDTPGMRELQLWDEHEGLEETFDDVTALAQECRFSDCSHEVEPGCAVVMAVEQGRLERDRLDSYHKLVRELRFLERKRDQRAAIVEKRRIKAMTKSYRRDHARDA
jgi:ribosome biogenesis GTPase